MSVATPPGLFWLPHQSAVVLQIIMLIFMNLMAGCATAARNLDKQFSGTSVLTFLHEVLTSDDSDNNLEQGVEWWEQKA